MSGVRLFYFFFFLPFSSSRYIYSKQTKKERKEKEKRDKKIIKAAEITTIIIIIIVTYKKKHKVMKRHINNEIHLHICTFIYLINGEKNNGKQKECNLNNLQSTEMFFFFK
ncbi:hypothetical protein, unlikely [Trypanosoma brucei gambiense DAL972]|uniref:Uncharacterized protein n=1 Tax=Trypanosoma brucei gambiense (strain MHOM/CI/86/DAL972) TaxID=679716 RepID=C9ZWV2_TRYB9|nr:hypothetical protein, unlikely [Trypanosoma brucei gambiense DAL972]CBH13891.1 hypothetical protein, unlikely [Trypanosoma brucei gambiense DAL972]|eukprot:XP_011776167.1 hypothetical protein, unlikely [Trypanosoma brucei gambiense DAL972]